MQFRFLNNLTFSNKNFAPRKKSADFPFFFFENCWSQNATVLAICQHSAIWLWITESSRTRIRFQKQSLDFFLNFFENCFLICWLGHTVSCTFVSKLTRPSQKIRFQKKKFNVFELFWIFFSKITYRKVTPLQECNSKMSPSNKSTFPHKIGFQKNLPIFHTFLIFFCRFWSYFSKLLIRSRIVLELDLLVSLTF